MRLIVETIALAGFVGLFAFRPDFGRWVWREFTALLSRAGRRPERSSVLVGLACTLLAATISLFVHFPQPSIQDEFSYLLAADTYAQGRLANPSHELWEHFESFHVIPTPTYGSKYPLGIGLVLAFGQLLGHPLVGSWLLAGVTCTATTWMLLAWLPSRWAFLGAFLMAARWCTASYWVQGYWGGMLAALGGALLFGAVRRLARPGPPSLATAVALGAGPAILAVARPYEGLAASLPAALFTCVWIVARLRRREWTSTLKLAAVSLLVACLGPAALALQAKATTGSALKMPYKVHEEMYARAPTFIWQDMRPEKSYRHLPLKQLHTGYIRNAYLKDRTLWGFTRSVGSKVRTFCRYYLGVALILPLLFLPAVLKRRWMRGAFWTCVFVALATFATVASQPHYPAPLTALVYALIVQALRHLACWRRTEPASGVNGRSLVAAILLASFVAWLGQVASCPSRQKPFSNQRAEILRSFEEEGGRHLVVVSYGQRHSYHREWVYNRADIDASSVVWARSMGEERDVRLLDYFSDRTVWLLMVDHLDDSPAELLPYPNVTSP